MLLFATRRSYYAIDPGLGMLMQLPGGTDCGLRQGVWHALVYDEQPKAGRAFFCSVAPRDGGAPVAIRTSRVQWVGPEPPNGAPTRTHRDAFRAFPAQRPQPGCVSSGSYGCFAR